MVLLYVGYVMLLCTRGTLEPSKSSQVLVMATVTKPVSFEVQRLCELLEPKNVTE
jgi:hypothetical protein